MIWHELVLNGIGGRTVAEAQANMSYVEFIRWCLYRRKTGSLNIGMRVEHGAALQASLFANAYGKKAYKLYDFAPHIEEPSIDLEWAMENWK